MVNSKFTPIAYTGSCEKALTEISNRALQQLQAECTIWLKFDTVVYTAVSSFTEQCAVYLREHPEEAIPVDALVKFMTVKSESETGEKAGNIVPVAEIGEEFIRLATSESEAPQAFDTSSTTAAQYKPIPYPEGYEKILSEISNRALQQINAEYSVWMKEAEVVYSNAVCFFRQCAAYLYISPDEEITLSSLIKFRMVQTENENGEKVLVPVAELGERFKLGVKNDNATEEDEEYDA